MALVATSKTAREDSIARLFRVVDCVRVRITRLLSGASTCGTFWGSSSQRRGQSATGKASEKWSNGLRCRGWHTRTGVDLQLYSFGSQVWAPAGDWASEDATLVPDSRLPVSDINVADSKQGHRSTRMGGGSELSISCIFTTDKPRAPAAQSTWISGHFGVSDADGPLQSTSASSRRRVRASSACRRGTPHMCVVRAGVKSTSGACRAVPSVRTCRSRTAMGRHNGLSRETGGSGGKTKSFHGGLVYGYSLQGALWVPIHLHDHLALSSSSMDHPTASVSLPSSGQPASSTFVGS
ncbi:hypothetical protein LZ30DRAFT_415958 [Colletotrichum cereale]|nr:hypothetical protein LZ30DRAFT_415958 [Colletotrichum cereale]